MAILNALAARQGSDFLSILQPSKDEINASKDVSKVKICALVDSNGKPNEVADLVTMIVEEGFTAIKLKVTFLPMSLFISVFIASLYDFILVPSYS